MGTAYKREWGGGQERPRTVRLGSGMTLRKGETGKKGRLGLITSDISTFLGNVGEDTEEFLSQSFVRRVACPNTRRPVLGWELSMRSTLSFPGFQTTAAGVLG